MIVLVLAACGGEVEGGGSGGSKAGSGGSNQGSGGSNAGGGGSNAGSGGSNQGGGGSGGMGGCPSSVPEQGSSCGSDLSCEYDATNAQCAMTPRVTVASCSNGAWSVLYPATCEPLPAGAACSPLGHYIVKETGPYDDPTGPAADYGGPFDLVLTTGPGGLVYVEGHRASLTSDGCSLKGGTNLSENCTPIDGQMFCSYIDRDFTLSFASTPATGTVTISCWGECGYESTAPAEAVKQP